MSSSARDISKPKPGHQHRFEADPLLDDGCELFSRETGPPGLYGPEHLRRLQLVISMLARGYPTVAIREVLEAWEDNKSVAQVLGFEEALAEPCVTVGPRRLAAEDVMALFPGADDAAFQRAVELEVLVPEDDAFVVPNPALLDTGAELVAHGVPLDVVLDTAAEIRAATYHLADVFVALFNDHVWRPFVDAGMPPEELPRITDFVPGPRRRRGGGGPSPGSRHAAQKGRGGALKARRDGKGGATPRLGRPSRHPDVLAIKEKRLRWLLEP